MSHRDRSKSLLNQGLPRTLAKLVDRLEKTVTSLVSKQLQIEEARASHQRTFGEATALLESTHEVITRIKVRVTSNPAKAMRLYADSELHAPLLRSVRTLIPSGWLYATYPAMAKGQVTAIESIVLRCGVSRWEWTQGSGKSNFVPIIFSAMVLFQGKPFAEPEDGSRLIDILVRAGATADPYGTEALVARAEQCEWGTTSNIITSMDKAHSLETYSPSKAADASSDDAPVAAAAPTAPAPAGPDAAAAAAAAAAEMEELAVRRRQSEQQLAAAELKLTQIKEERRVADAAAAARLQDIMAEEAELEPISSDEEEDYKERPLAELIAEEMARLRAEATDAANSKLAGQGPIAGQLSGFGADEDVPESVGRALGRPSGVDGFDNDDGAALAGADGAPEGIPEGAEDGDEDPATDDEDEHVGDVEAVAGKIRFATTHWHDDHAEHAEQNEMLVALAKSVTSPTFLSAIEYTAEGEDVGQLGRAIIDGKAGALATLVYCGGLSNRTTWSTPIWPLHLVAQQTTLSASTLDAMIDVLVSGGVYINELDATGKTAFDVATAAGNEPCLATLASYFGMASAELCDI